MAFKVTHLRWACLCSRSLVPIMAIVAPTACIAQKTPSPQSTQPAQAEVSNAGMAKPTGSNSALPVTTPKAECESKPPSACVEPPQPEDPEHERWAHETEKQFKQFLSKLKDCGRGLESDRDLRVILTLDFAESGIPTGEHVYRATTGNCELVSCLKRAVQGFTSAPHKSMHWKYSAYLSRLLRNAKTLVLPAYASINGEVHHRPAM